MTKRKRCQSSIEQPVEKVPLTDLKELVSNTLKEVQSSEIITQNTGSNTNKLKRVLNVQQQMLDLINKF